MEYNYGEGNVTVTKETNKYVVIIKSKGAYQIDENGDVTIKSGIILDKSSVNLQIIDTTPGEEIIAATLEEIDGEIRWNSSDTNKVIVTPIDEKSAKITAVANTAEDIEVIATCGRESATCTVKVTTVKSISSISVSPTSATIKRGRQCQITATVDAEATETVKWLVDDENTDKVRLSAQTGNVITVTGLALGQNIEIIAKGEKQNKIARCNITVEPGPGYFIQNGDVAYYYPDLDSTENEKIPITEENMGDYLGLEVYYTPRGTISCKRNDNSIIEIGTSTIYRLFYIDVKGKYGEKGCIYLKADQDGIGGPLKGIPNTDVGHEIVDTFNPMWDVSGLIAKENMSYVSKLLDKNIWSPYIDKEDIASYVVGGPSLEMWIDSYNAFFLKNKVDNKYTYICTCTRNDTNGPKGENKGNGYYVGYNGVYSGRDGYYPDESTLAIPRNYSESNIVERLKAWNKGESGSYWLSSPAAYRENWISAVQSNRIDYNNTVTYNIYNSYCEFCPLVCCNPMAKVKIK